MLFQASLLEENIKPRANLPPLLVHLRERRPEKLHYLGVSFGLTQELFRFWRKHNFYPFYVGQIPVMISDLTCHSRPASCFMFCCAYCYFFFQSAVTGEHTCMVLRPLNSDDIEVSEANKCGFLDPFYQGTKFLFCSILFAFLTETG
jgi:N-acetyltransferase 10